MIPGRPLFGLHIPLLSGLTLLAGCSTFNRDWNAMAETAQPTEGLEGRWSGTWVSESNGHTGKLRCIITRAEDEGDVHARYHATYWGFLTFEYAVPMEVWTSDGGETYRFAGEADLGWLAGGRYEYEGTVEGDQFTSTYECKQDHGTFQMTRVE